MILIISNCWTIIGYSIYNLKKEKRKKKEINDYLVQQNGISANLEARSLVTQNIYIYIYIYAWQVVISE